MRRFIRTITARRHVNFFVMQDGDRRRFEVLRWSAEEEKPVFVEAFAYLPDADGSEEEDLTGNQIGQAREEARREAIILAQRLADAEVEKHRSGRSDEEAGRIAQQMTPGEQERRRIDRLLI